MDLDKAKHHASLYPEIETSNWEGKSIFVSNSAYSNSSMYPSVVTTDLSKSPESSQSSLYPIIDLSDLAENLFPDTIEPSATVESFEKPLIKIPGAIVHLIDKQNSVEIACGDLSMVQLQQGENVVAILARIDEQIQWPLAKDEAVVKLDESHYFFSLHIPGSDDEDDASKGQGSDELLNYGLTLASKGQEGLLSEFDGILEKYSSFSLQRVSEKSVVVDGSMAKGVSPSEMASRVKKEMMEKRSAVYWTTLAPNVEEYSGNVSRAIAAGSGHLIKGILWCGDVTVDRLNWANEFLKKGIDSPSKPSEISPQTLKRIRRAKRVTKMTEKVATGVLSGVLKVSGFFTSSVVNSRAGKKFFSLLPGEIVLATLDGFGKICDAAEEAGKNVLSTSSVVITELVSHKYGDQAAKATSEGLDAAGYAVGAAWAVFKLRKALNPKSVLKPSSLAKSAVKSTSKCGKKKK